MDAPNIQRRYFSCFDDLGLHNPTIMTRSPRVTLWLIPQGCPRIGLSPDGVVYMAKSVYRDEFAAEFPEFEKSLTWMNNQNFIVLAFHANAVVLDRFNQHLDPAWFSWDEFAAIARSPETFRTLQPYAVGRFDLDGDSVAPCSTDAIWLASCGAVSIDKIKVTPNVHRLFDNFGSRFGGKPLQIWSDGAVTKLDSTFNSKSIVQPQYKLTREVMFLLQHALRQRYWLNDSRYSKLMKIQSVSSVETLDAWEHRHTGLFSYESGEITLTRWQTDAGDLWIVKHEWGYLAEDGDAGEDVYVFDVEIQARQEFAGEKKNLEVQL